MGFRGLLAGNDGTRVTAPYDCHCTPGIDTYLQLLLCRQVALGFL